MSQAAGYVYAIENKLNGRCYIGSASDYKSRWHTHRSTLRRGVHHSFVLQRAWDKYGEEAFTFKLLVICPLDQRIEYENRLMPLQSYNILRTAKEKLVRGGWHHTEEFRQKISALHKGRSLTEEHRHKLSVAAKAREYGEEYREKVRTRQLQMMAVEDYRARTLAAAENGRKSKTERCQERVRVAYEAVLAGVTVAVACEQSDVTQRSFYKHTKTLSLPLPGHANRCAKTQRLSILGCPDGERSI
jgi:group I intron endonuclease